VRTALWFAALLMIAAGTMPTRVHACSVLSDQGCPVHNIAAGTLTTTDGVVRHVRLIITRQFHYGDSGYFRCIGGWCPSRRGKFIGGGGSGEPAHGLGLFFRDVNRTAYGCKDGYLSRRLSGGSCDLYENDQLVTRAAATLTYRWVGH
jgi:hypothetical protein